MTGKEERGSPGEAGENGLWNAHTVQTRGTPS